MADESRYDTHKRKYEEDTLPPPPPRRRATGFSDGPPSAAPPPQYGSVPPPMDEFAALKQNFQQIASRALNNSNLTSGTINSNNNNFDTKRSKFDNSPPPYSSNYNSYSDQKHMSSGNQYGSTPSIPSTHGYSGSGSKKIGIPNGRVGVIIGKSGETIKYLQNQSGARIQIKRDSEHDPNSPNREVELMGSQDQIAKAEQLIHDVIAEADNGGPGSVSRKMPPAPGSEQFVMKVPSNKVGLVIGKGGETIKNIQSQSGANVQVIPLHPPPEDMSMERTVRIEGTSEQIEIAKQMVYDAMEIDGSTLWPLYPYLGEVHEKPMLLVKEAFSVTKRNRDPAMSGGYSQQGYQTRPPTNWAPQPPQTQQAGAYGYMQQPGAYPGAPSQYNQQAYPGYPPQPASGGYPQNWDPSGAPQTQQAPQGSGYDYYGQQQPTQQQQPPSGAQTDNSGYNYSQAPSGAYSQQGYSQEGYPGGYQAATGQAGYDQQQHGYGPASTQSQDANPSSYSAQGETAQGQTPASQPQQGYAGQPAYGMPPASQSAYGAPSPAQGGYYGQPQGQRTPPPNPPAAAAAAAAYGQAGYPPSQTPAQPGYGQPDGGAPRSAYGGSTAQPGTYPTPYGAPPSYGQPPAYYGGGGYSQPPAYPTDGVGSATAATPSPASQPAAQSTGPAKRSP